MAGPFSSSRIVTYTCENLYIEELVDMRRKSEELYGIKEAEQERDTAATTDANPPADEGFRKQDFEDVLRKATRRFEPELEK